MHVTSAILVTSFHSFPVLMTQAAGQGLPAHTLNNVNLGAMGTTSGPLPRMPFSFHQPHPPCSLSPTSSRKSFQIIHAKLIFSFPDNPLLFRL